jgi:hypothetical protein
MLFSPFTIHLFTVIYLTSPLPPQTPPIPLYHLITVHVLRLWITVYFTAPQLITAPSIVENMWK